MLDPIKDIFRLSGLPDPVLHVLLGLAIYIVAAALLRRSRHSWTPLLVLLSFQLINEAADVARDLLNGDHIGWRGGIFDTVMTMALPTMLLLIGRYVHGGREKRREALGAAILGRPASAEKLPGSAAPREQVRTES